MKWSVIFLMLYIGVGYCQVSQGNFSSKKAIEIAFYNVENLFDTIDDKHKLDNEFLPDGKKRWNSQRYQEKLKNLAVVIDSLKSGKLGPDLIGLCEVETKQVIQDLAREPSIKKNKYEVVHFECNDMRGIDVAAMYNPKKIRLLHSEAIFVPFPEDGRIKTRDVLYLKVQTKKSKDTLHVFFNHWPSRRGGEEKSEWKRIRAAESLMHKIDSVSNIEANANVIIMGDMNDYPINKSVKEVVCGDSIITLINLLEETHLNGKGTYCYKGEWGVLDNVIVSIPLLTNYYCGILNKNWMMYTNKKGEQYPSKTYGGTNYYGGYSDHLPVYLWLEW